jgi:hypothetical protein
LRKTLAYRRLPVTSDHHWIGLKPEPSAYFGFVYEMHHCPSGKKYIGRKNFWFSSGKAKVRPTNIRSKKWKSWHWVPSDWRWYRGSPTVNKQFIHEDTHKDDWEHILLGQYVCARDLSYAEPQIMYRRGVGHLRDDDGELVYLNHTIPKFNGATTEYFEEGHNVDDR